ncbi:MAG TPA: fasciclin domain-containing protein [Sphingomonas sp.]|nr:fasciclin domain-containing protein [Sphingomonas sp.]
MKRLAAAALAGALLLAGCSAPRDDRAATPAPVPTPAAAPNPMVGGVPMPADRTIAENAATSPTLSTLAAALRAAGLVGTLSSPGPFTVFAPTDEAFARLAPGMVDTLLKPENKASLVKVVTYHVVPGTLTTAELTRRIATGGGIATLTTVEGDVLTLDLTEGNITLTDVNGNASYVETGDVRQANGIVHVVNGVLVPRLG